ncbi:MAG TPA: phosphate-starvation-inducible PsiE family protein [Stellaceae bacterium]|jgi:uncharacterized membrane protein (DUF373 family)
MRLRDEVEGAGRLWPTLTFYGKFEHVVVLVLITLIALVIATATWHLAWNIIHLLILGILDPADPATFQTIFGMIFTVLIALEFKHSLLVVLERQDSVIQVRAIVLIAILALVRKFIILDLKSTPATELFALATAILTLGAVYWLVRDQDRREDMWRRRRATRRPGPGLPSEPYPGAGVAGEDAP